MLIFLQYDGEIKVLYQVTIISTLTNKKWSGNELSVKAGEKLDVIVGAVDNKLICRNEEGKCEYFRMSLVFHYRLSSMNNNTDSQCLTFSLHNSWLRFHKPHCPWVRTINILAFIHGIYSHCANHFDCAYRDGEIYDDIGDGEVLVSMFISCKLLNTVYFNTCYLFFQTASMTTTKEHSAIFSTQILYIFMIHSIAFNNLCICFVLLLLSTTTIISIILLLLILKLIILKNWPKKLNAFMLLLTTYLTKFFF